MPRKGAAAPRRPLPRAVRSVAGSAPGSIIAAIIDTHAATKKENEPSVVATPMFIPSISCTATTQQMAATPTVDTAANTSTTGIASASWLCSLSRSSGRSPITCHRSLWFGCA
jgi:hypothetical protein